MSIQAKLLCAVAVSGFAAFAATAPAQALTTQECSAKYQAAKTAGTLNGQKWNDFRKAECAADAAAAPATAPAAAPAPAPAPCTPACRTTSRRPWHRISTPPGGSRPRGGPRSTCRPCRVPVRRGFEIFQGNRRQGPHAHLRRSIQRQQGRQRQWRHEMDREGRRLLQRVQQEAEGLSLPDRLTRPDDIPAALRIYRPAMFRPILRSAARACAGRVRETAGSGRR